MTSKTRSSPDISCLCAGGHRPRLKHHIKVIHVMWMNAYTIYTFLGTSCRSVVWSVVCVCVCVCVVCLHNLPSGRGVDCGGGSGWIGWTDAGSGWIGWIGRTVTNPRSFKYVGEGRRTRTFFWIGSTVTNPRSFKYVGEGRRTRTFFFGLRSFITFVFAVSNLIG